MEAGTNCKGGVANYVGEEQSFETRIKSNLIGQESAIPLVASAIQQKQIGQSNKGRPLVLLFLGLPGVGKTELTKQVAQCIHVNDEIALIPIHMHGYQDGDSVEDMFGSPPGDNWHEHYGVLAQALRLRKNAVILPEEIEFAHPAVLSALLRMFNEGHFVTGHGQIIESTHAIFIMTSKLASEVICQQGKQLIVEQEARHDEPLERTVTRGLCVSDANHGQMITSFTESELKFVRPILEEHFYARSVGFLNRIDQMVQFTIFRERNKNARPERARILESRPEIESLVSSTARIQW